MKERFINIRKLAALDIVFHGPRLILAEFALAVFLCGVLGISSLSSFFRDPNHPSFPAILGLFLIWMALNYLPLLLYAVSIVRRKSAQREAAFELEHKDIEARKYTVQSLLLFLPLIVPVLAISQEIQSRSRSKRSQ